MSADMDTDPLGVSSLDGSTADVSPLAGCQVRNPEAGAI
jgi:hypothetical protein